MELQKTLCCIVASFLEKPEVVKNVKRACAQNEFAVLFSSADNSFTPVQFFQQDNSFAIVHSLETEEQMPNLTVVTEAVYCRKQAPLIKVLFCDHSVAAFPSEGTGNSAIVAKYKEILIPRMRKKQSSPMIQLTKQVSRILAGSTAVLFCTE